MLSPILATVLATLATGTGDAVARQVAAEAAATKPFAERLAEATVPDPNDIAMAFGSDDPCTAPCWRTGLVYQHTASALNPDAGIRSYALDLYRSSKTPARDAPVVVLVHGGGFVTGDRTQMRDVAGALANAGYLAATIDYRLVPESRNGGVGIASEADLIPASAEAEADAERALRWIRAHRKSLGAAKAQSRYAVGGYSAGAITALRVAVRGGDRKTLPQLRFRVGAAFAFSGTECGSWTKAYDCSAAYDRKDAPILLFQGEADSIVPLTWARSTCRSAERHGGGCTGYYYPRQDHFWANGTVFGGGEGLTKRHPAAMPTILSFLRKHLTAD